MNKLRIFLLLSCCIFSFGSLYSQEPDMECSLVKKMVPIQECTIKDPTLKRIMKEMLNRVEEEKIFGKAIPHRKILYFEKTTEGFIIKMSIVNSYVTLEDWDPNTLGFFTYDNEQVLITKMDEEIFNHFFGLKQNKGDYVLYTFKYIKDDSTCLDLVVINQTIIYETRGVKYRFQERTLTHTELNW